VRQYTTFAQYIFEIKVFLQQDNTPLSFNLMQQQQL